MAHWNRLLAVLAGSAIAAIVQPQLAMALTPEEIAEIAREITVRIDGPNSGSGVIVDFDRDTNTYTVLTNWHVVEDLGTYQVQTSDGRIHQVPIISGHQLEKFDLAVLQFSSEVEYQVAELGDPEDLSHGTVVYVSGWANPDGISPNRYYRFEDGQITAIVEPQGEGYSLVYPNISKPGMSGGPILDEDGDLVGINGQVVIDARLGTVDSLGIPTDDRFLTAYGVFEYPSDYDIRCSTEVIHTNNLKYRPSLCLDDLDTPGGIWGGGGRRSLPPSLQK